MRISEMTQREPFTEILSATLSAGWSEQYGGDVQVLPPDATRGIEWLVQPVLSACYVPQVMPSARRFLRESFRYSSRPLRRPAQWVLGTLLTTSLGIRISGHPYFRAAGRLPYPEALLVLPGNQRIRVFDFATGVVRTFLKVGFDPGTMLREIEIRGTGRVGPFPSLTRWDSHGRWIEEGIIDGWPLPACPATVNRGTLEEQAFALLDRWLTESAEAVDARAWSTKLQASIRSHAENLDTRFPFAYTESLNRWATCLAAQAATLGEITVAESHGDFQPGNIYVERATGEARLIDWEHSRRCFAIYDVLVYYLRLRFPLGLAGRLRGYCSGARLPQWPGFQRTDARARQAELALVLLEDLDWRAGHSIAGVYHAVPASLMAYCRELESLGPNLEDLFTRDGSS